METIYEFDNTVFFIFHRFLPVRNLYFFSNFIVGKTFKYKISLKISRVLFSNLIFFFLNGKTNALQNLKLLYSFFQTFKSYLTVFR